MPPSDPLVINNLTPDVWTPVAVNLLSGFLHILNPDFIYYQTYRLTGNPAPTNAAPGDPDFEGVPVYNRQDRIAGETVFIGGASIGLVSGADVYIYPATVTNTESAFGKIRIDQGA